MEKTNKNTIKGRLMTGLGMLALAAGMGGCATSTGGITKISGKMDELKTNELILMGWPIAAAYSSAKSICKGDEQDPRCQPGEIEKFQGAYIRVRGHMSSNIDVPTLVPLTAKEFPVWPDSAIVKIRQIRGKIAYYEGVMAQGLSNPECYNEGGFGRGTAGPGGVICPKYGYDYRSIPALN